MAVCDKSPAARRRMQRRIPESQLQPKLPKSWVRPISMPSPWSRRVWTHYELAKAALENGKHVFVEKPFTSNTAQAEELIELATKKNLKIMVDHTFLFTGAVKKIRELVDEGALGKLYYYDSTRVNLGLFQHDINVIWDLALMTIDHGLLDQGDSEAIVATGQTHLNGFRRRGFHDPLFSGEGYCPHQCELAVSG